MLTSLLLGGFLMHKVLTGPPTGYVHLETLNIDPANPLLFERSAAQCVCPNTRSRLDILWSCLSTIFLCTWVAVHPNMPGRGDGWLRRYLDRGRIMLGGLLVPEAVLVFSLRQWRGARDIAKEYRKHGWTMTHGFFLIMGGFNLRKGDEDLGVLYPELFRSLYESGDIEFPSINQEEIEDKSKGDSISKFLVILQTLWFTVQCIARRVQGLSVTELELTTLGYCSLSAAMYVMWWYKPLDVQYSVPVYLKADSKYMPKKKPQLKRARRITEEDAIALEAALNNESLGAELAQPILTKLRHICHRTWCSFVETWTRVENAVISLAYELKGLWKEQTENHNMILVLLLWIYIAAMLCIWAVFLSWPDLAWFILVSAMRDVRSLLSFEGKGTEVRPGSARVGMAYSPPLQTVLQESLLFGVTIAVAGSTFGGMHLVAWGFEFPTVLERNLWRMMSVVITTTPAFFLLQVATNNIAQSSNFRLDAPGHRLAMEYALLLCWLLGSIFCFIFELLVYLFSFSYIPARIILLFEAFFLLRQLPPSALLNIDWFNFIPHL